MVYQLKAEDVRLIKSHFPGLHLDLIRKCIWGTLTIASAYDSSTKLFTPEARPEQRGYIEEDYEIRIKFDEADTFGFPAVYEESGFLINAAKNSNQVLSDWHINDNGSICLGIFPEYRCESVKDYILDKVIPYFYWVAYRARYGVEPWRAYRHGVEGLRDALRFPEDKINSKVRNLPCPCASGKKYKNCCLRRDDIILRVLQSQKKSRVATNGY